MIRAQRLDNLGSAVFSEMDRIRRQVEQTGLETINLSIGSPDLPPAPHVQEALIAACRDPAQFGYALSDGLPEFKQAVAAWYAARFNVELDPATEVLSLMGSQDGLAHICQAFLNPGDYALVPDPGYPVYTAGVCLAGGIKYPLPLTAANNFLPDLNAIPAEIAAQAKLIFINYPSNPVAAVAGHEFFRQVVDFAREYDIVVCHDIAYSELAYDGYQPVSFLEVPGARDVGVEFHSLSKTYNLAGARLGFVVGNPRIIADLAMVKSNIDFGVFKPVQKAGIAALTGPQDWVENLRQTYQERRNLLVGEMRSSGWQLPLPKASMFIWAPLPSGWTNSLAFATELAQQTGVIVVPGTGFGEYGEGYVRLALVSPAEKLREAARRLAAFL